MSETVAPTRSRWPRGVVALLCLYFLISGAVFGYLGVERFFTHWHWLNDLHYFYESAQLVTSDQRHILYDTEARHLLLRPDRDVNQEVFPFPATLALLFWPLTLTSFETARWIFVGISVGCCFGIVLLAYRWSRDVGFALLVVAAQASLFTLYETIRFSQLSPLIALVACATLLGLQSPRSLRGDVLPGLLVFKPSLAITPLAFLLWFGDVKRIAAAAAMGLVVAVLIPLVLVGPNGIYEYLQQLTQYRDEAFKLDGTFTAGAGWMLNWNGFLGRLFKWDPSPLAVLPLGALTLATMLKVWLRSDVFNSWLAAWLTTLLIIPHAVWYDWVVLLGVAPFVVYRSRSLPLLALLVALHLSVSIDSYVIVTSPVTDHFFFSNTLIAAAILGYLAFAPQPAVSPAPVSTAPARLTPGARLSRRRRRAAMMRNATTAGGTRQP